MKTFLKCLAILLAMTPLMAEAEDWYVGTTFVESGDTHACIIARFKAVDGSYTLSQADAIYDLVSSALVDQDLGSVKVDSDMPSTNHDNGYTGEGLANYFISQGTGVCTIGGVPVDAVIFLSAFRCEYQNENQMCFRLYVDLGELDMRSVGVPQGPATIGGIFIKREVWDAAFAMILENPGLIDQIPDSNDILY
ncbi:hypothetical protein D779_1911 [Imhoffiella purpurea]|uniref:DUF4468 domain-containing protein n=2 Tax=Imhoffiella purpurea TaxID=1249627 RepID=W9VG77_9GAMM|nr:hypothetical protein D779_1911 [Imhoffiella purpurea]